MKIIIASKDRSWSNKLISNLRKYFANIIFVNTQEDLEEQASKINPDWIFFFHWSKIVHRSFYEKYKCVVIHTGVLPVDRGGSPIQNQILAGRKITNVNALVMQEPVDSGAVYRSEQISLQGSLNDIWDSITEAATKVIWRCVTLNPIPWPQDFESDAYERKTDNELKVNSISSMYDQIRMLDGDGYPRTSLTIDGFKFEFSRAKLSEDTIVADVKIYKA